MTERWKREPRIVKAKKVREGDFLPGLGDGYVIGVERNPKIGFGRYNVDIGSEKVWITFNDANGDELYLLLTPDCPVSIRRDEQI